MALEERRVKFPIISAHLKTLVDTFPNVDPYFLQEHVINTYFPKIMEKCPFCPYFAN